MKKRVVSVILQLSLVTLTLGGTFGLVYGLSTIDRYPEFIDLDDTNNSNQIDYEAATPKETTWNCDGEPDPFLIPLDEQKRENYPIQVLDGAAHEILDKGFNQSAYRGMANWAYNPTWTPEDGNENFPTDEDLEKLYGNNKWGYGRPAADAPDAFGQAYLAAINAGARSLVLPGYIHSAPLMSFETNPSFKDAGYILIDSDIKNSKNISSVIFRADQSAFISGLAACQYLSIDNYDHYIQKGSLKAGVFGATPIPTVTIFMGGFERAIQFFNNYLVPKLQIVKGWSNEETESHKVNVINLGQEDSFFTGTFVIGDGRSVAQDLLARGADVILPVCSPQTVDVVQEIKNQKSDCVVIGVDTDLENGDMNDDSVYDDGSGSPYAKKIIKFSAEKSIDYITSTLLYMSANGIVRYPATGDDIQYGGYGYLTVGTLINKGCKISNAGQDYFVNLINLINPDQTFATYTDAINWFISWKYAQEELSPLDFLNKNMYFNY